MNTYLKNSLFFIGAYFIIALANFGYLRFINKEVVLLKITSSETQGVNAKYVLLKTTFDSNKPIDLTLKNRSFKARDIVCGTIRYEYPRSVVDFFKISFGQGTYYIETFKVLTEKSKKDINAHYLFREENRLENLYAILFPFAILGSFFTLGLILAIFRDPRFLQSDGSLVFRKNRAITYVKILFYSFIVIAIVAGGFEQLTEEKLSFNSLDTMILTLVVLAFLGFSVTLLVVEILGRKDYLRLQANYISFQSFKKYREVPVVHVQSFELKPKLILLTTELESITISLAELNIGAYEENIQLELRRLLLYRAEEIIAEKD